MLHSVSASISGSVWIMSLLRTPWKERNKYHGSVDDSHQTFNDNNPSILLYSVVLSAGVVQLCYLLILSDNDKTQLP